MVDEEWAHRLSAERLLAVPETRGARRSSISRAGVCRDPDFIRESVDGSPAPGPCVCPETGRDRRSTRLSRRGVDAGRRPGR